MATVLNRNTREILYSVNTPDYPETDWIINPDISVVEKVPNKYWKIEGNSVLEMTTIEKEIVDGADLPHIKKDKISLLENQTIRFVLNRGYTSDIQRSLMSMYSESVGFKPNLSAYLQEWVSWIKRVDFEKENKKKLIKDQTSINGVNSIFVDFEALATYDPIVTLYDALAISDSTKLDLFYKNTTTDELTGVSGPDYLINLFRLRREIYNDTTNPLYVRDYTPVIDCIQDYSSRLDILEGSNLGGVTGVQGEEGKQGLTGIQGIKGDFGSQGNTGAQGVIGPQGNTGIQGLGLTGLKGETGIQGVGGNIGVQGVTGLMGLGATGLQGLTGVQIDANRLITNIEVSRAQRIFSSDLAPGRAAFLLISGTAYFVYLGRVVQGIIPKYVEFQVSTAGSGAQTAEVGLFSSSNPPDKAGQSLSKIVSTGTVDSLTGTGVKRNTDAFNTSVSAGTHLWAGIRTAMVTTQPTIWGFGTDMAQGNILRTTGTTVLTGTGPWTGAIIAATTSTCCPDLRVTLD